jgi:CheY-like chemotaxis protein
MKKVLLVEDDPNLAEIISDMLILNGYIVSVAASGDYGQHSPFGYKPDVVISNVSTFAVGEIDLREFISQYLTYRKLPAITLP